MAPKKKPQTKQSNRPVASSSSSIPNSNHKKPSKVPKLLISPEDEDHLRRLLLNFRRTVSPARAPMHSALYVAQKKKKIIYLYEKLSCEGFLNEQIESALSSLRVKLSHLLKFFEDNRFFSVTFLHFIQRFLIKSVDLCVRMKQHLRLLLIGSV